MKYFYDDDRHVSDMRKEEGDMPRHTQVKLLL